MEGGLSSDFTVLREENLSSCLSYFYTYSSKARPNQKLLKPNFFHRQWKIYWVEFILLVFDQLFLWLFMHRLCTMSAWSACCKMNCSSRTCRGDFFLEISIPPCNVSHTEKTLKQMRGTLQATDIRSKMAGFFWFIFLASKTAGGLDGLMYCVDKGAHKMNRE